MPNTWYKEDNVAKVFLASVTRRDPRVFRISCTLTEDIDPDALAAALQRTAGDLPNFQVTLHRGLFWHYLEASGKCPRPEPEHRRPCAAIYGRDIKNELLYRVSYYGARINVEMFHALSDGNGGLLFLKVLVHNYLALRHPDELEGVARDEGASAADMAEDSFQQFYARRKAAFAPADPAARRPVCRLHGRRLPLDQTQFFEGHLPVKDVLAKARALGVTLTSYLAAAQMLAVWQETPALERGRAIAVGLPVNLRNYFPSDTARNFFNTIRVAHVFTGDETLDTLAPELDAKLKAELSPERIMARMDGFQRFERIPGVRPVPLPVKNAVVGLCNWVESRKVTFTLSNMGRVQTAPELAPYIKGFAAYCSSDGLFTTVCSYGGDLVLGSVSALRSTNILRNFYRSLAESGLAVTLYASEVETE